MTETSGAHRFETMIITNTPESALFWEAAGVDIIFIDLETTGKMARQGHVDSVKSRHTIDDIDAVSAVLTKSKTLVRINPHNSGTESEIESSIQNGADIIMLPMFETKNQIAETSRQIDNRCAFYPLLETPAALEIVHDLIGIRGVSGYHFGLNDLHLAMKMRFMFQVMLSDIFLHAVNIFRQNGVFFGIGGVSRVGTGTLVSDVIIREGFRLGSKRVILSRGFKSGISTPTQAAHEVNAIQDIYAGAGSFDLRANHAQFVQQIGAICGNGG